jgi:hypothetical protein
MHSSICWMLPLPRAMTHRAREVPGATRWAVMTAMMMMQLRIYRTTQTCAMIIMSPTPARVGRFKDVKARELF